jgi:hypothetical protein
MKNFTKIIGFVLALATTSAQAIPTLYFDGDISYLSGELAVSASLTETTDILPTPTLDGSTLIFTAFLDSVETLTASGCFFFCATSTKGNFVGDASSSVDDLEIYDGDGTTLLLSAKFSSLSLEGANGGTTGEVIGLLSATGGSLENIFDGSDLFALQLNLSTTFSSTMYDMYDGQEGFTGMVDGNIEGHSVAEPSPLALLGLGILIAGFARRKSSL